MNNEDSRALYTMLGAVGADVKHILSTLDKSAMQMEKFKEDTEEQHKALSARVSSLEHFKVRALAYGTVAVFVLTTVAAVGKDLVLKFIME